MASAITMSCVYLSFMLPNLNSSMHLPQRQVRLPSHVFQYTILYKLKYFTNLNSSAIKVDDFPLFTMPRIPENRLSCRDQSFTLPVYTYRLAQTGELTQNKNRPLMFNTGHEVADNDQWDQLDQLWQSWKESLKKLGLKLLSKQNLFFGRFIHLSFFSVGPCFQGSQFMVYL